MDYDPDEDWSPARKLGAYAWDLYSDYEGYWNQDVVADSESTAWNREPLARLKEIGEAVVPCLHSLNVDGQLVETVRRFLQSLGASNEVDQDLAAQVARAMNAHPVVATASE